MALKLKDEQITTVQKTGSDYVNRDYSKMADDILKGEEELPESRYSSSNTYHSMNNDMRSLNAQFEIDKYKYEDNTYTGFNKISRFDTGRTLPRMKWFTDARMDNPISLYLAIVVCAFFMIFNFHKAMTSLRDLGRDTVEVEATITSVEKREHYVKRGRRHGRWEDQYITTYEWVGENGEIQSNTRYYDERKFYEGDIATVTVLANNLNQEIDSKTTAKGKVASGFLFCIASGAITALLVIRVKKLRE